MEKEFVPYEQALSLKELGFDEPCFGYYYASDRKEIGLEMYIDVRNQDIYYVSAPLYQQVFRWFRDKYGLYGYPFSQSSQTNYWFKYFIQQDWKEQITSDSFNTSEEAELECLKKLIEIVKK